VVKTINTSELTNEDFELIKGIQTWQPHRKVLKMKRKRIFEEVNDSHTSIDFL
jgi:hypothetical protein